MNYSPDYSTHLGELVIRDENGAIAEPGNSPIVCHGCGAMVHPRFVDDHHAFHALIAGERL